MMEALGITRNIVINATREKVWAALTDPVKLEAVFGVPFRFARLAVDEMIYFSDEGDNGDKGVIDLVAPPERFGFRWSPMPGNPTQTRILFKLDSIDGGTRLTVTEDGFEALPLEARQHHFDDNSRGWEIVLEEIAKIVTE